jgi:hypothetical protein
MSYSEFTWEDIENRFNIILQEGIELFDSINPVQPSSLLQEVLKLNIPLALEINTEKARSELIIAPVLVEIRNYFKQKISLFSGREFSVEPALGLTGRCDFLMSHSPTQLQITAPVMTLVEAKNDNIQSGIPQCIAEAIAAQLFNERRNNKIPCIYGCVTTGSLWRFLRLEGKIVSLEPQENFIGNIETLLGIFAKIIETTKPPSENRIM